MALPDGRTQVVNYHTDGDSGNIQDVIYEGVPTYGPTPAVAHQEPVVHHASVVHHAPVVHQAPLVTHHGAVHHGAHHGLLVNSAVQNVHIPKFIG